MADDMLMCDMLRQMLERIATPLTTSQHL